MPRVIDRNTVNVLVDVRLLNDNGTPNTGLLFNTAGLDVEYKKQEDSSWTSLTLVTMTLGTWVDSGFIEDGDGWYQIGLPSAAIDPGKETRIRVSTTGNDKRYGSVVATGAADQHYPAFR